MNPVFQGESGSSLRPIKTEGMKSGLQNTINGDDGEIIAIVVTEKLIVLKI